MSRITLLGAVLLLLVGNSAAARGRNPCLEALEEQSARELHCPREEMWLWPAAEGPAADVEVGGCGWRATYSLAHHHRDADGAVECVWSATRAPWIDPDAAQNELRLNLGVGAPTGLAGVSFERRLGSIAALEPGGGGGLSGFQLSLLVRVRHIPILGAPGFGVSVAGGPGPGWLVGQKKGAIVWLDAELLGLEHRFASGLALGVGAGIVVPLAGEFSVCRSTCTAVESQSFIYPAFRLGVGWWL